MKTAILALLLCLPAFANRNNQVSVVLDAGDHSLTLHDTTSGTDVTIPFAPGTGERVRFTVIPSSYYPPAADTTYTACHTPCTVSVDRSVGWQYRFEEYVNSLGNPLTPPKKSPNMSAYDRMVKSGLGCVAGVGVLPMIAPAADTTAPLVMPREVMSGGDCYRETSQLPLAAGHASTNLRNVVNIHSPTHVSLSHYDNKVGLQINSSAEIAFTNANTGIHAVDSQRWFARNGSGTEPGQLGTIKNFGGYAQVREYLADVPDGAIGSSDTTYNQTYIFYGSEGDGSGFRIRHSFLIEGTDKTCASITYSGMTGTATCAGHGFSANETVYLRGTPGPYNVAWGLRKVLTVPDANTFTFTACRAEDPNCSTVGVPSAPPVNRNPVAFEATDQDYIYAARSLVPSTAFTEEDPTTWTAPVGGDAAKGECLFDYGNETCTAGQFDQITSPVSPHLDYKFHTAKCSTCHVPTVYNGAEAGGADLKYFNYSNKSAKARSIFHGFTAAQGDHIAAYIRALNIQPGLLARPWNPPVQTGPGMACCTFKRSDSTLTKITASSNLLTFYVPSHGLRTGDPVYVRGATVDTDLGSNAAPRAYAITVTGSGTFTATGSSVTDNATTGYTESTLVITMPNNLIGGAGVDAVTSDCYGSVLPSFGSDKSKWIYDQVVDQRGISYCWQLGDWNRTYLPVFPPADAYPAADYLNSNAYTHMATYIGALATAGCPYTVGCFAAYKLARTWDNTVTGGGTTTLGYGGKLSQGMMNDHFNFYGRDVGSSATNEFKFLDYTKPGTLSPSLYNLFRVSVPQTMMTRGFFGSTLGMGTLGFEDSRMLDVYGAAGNMPIGQSGNVWFNAPAPHKMTNDFRLMFDGEVATSWVATNVMYMSSLVINGGNGRGKGDNPSDIPYLYAYAENQSRWRGGGYLKYLAPAILAVQNSNQNANMGFESTHNDDGIEWTPILRVPVYSPSSEHTSYWHFTAAAWTTKLDDDLNRILGILNSHTVAYWKTTIGNALDATGASGLTCSATLADAWRGGGQLRTCDSLRSDVTWFSAFGANGTNTNALRDLGELIFVGQDFHDDITAGLTADLSLGLSGSITTAQPISGNTLTLTNCPDVIDGNSRLPLPFYVSSSSAPTVVEYLYGYSDCSVVGGSGTVIFYTTLNHAGTKIITYGVGPVFLKPNFNSGGQPVHRAKNMLD